MAAAAADVFREGEWFIFACPHCHHPVQVHVNDVACKIFRHGYFFEKKEDGAICLTKQVPPHASKALCDKWVEDGKIMGCGKPFKMDGTTVVACDYI